MLVWDAYGARYFCPPGRRQGWCLRAVLLCTPLAAVQQPRVRFCSRLIENLRLDEFRNSSDDNNVVGRFAGVLKSPYVFSSSDSQNETIISSHRNRDISTVPWTFLLVLLHTPPARS